MCLKVRQTTADGQFSDSLKAETTIKSVSEIISSVDLKRIWCYDTRADVFPLYEREVSDLPLAAILFGDAIRSHKSVQRSLESEATSFSPQSSAS